MRMTLALTFVALAGCGGSEPSATTQTPQDRITGFGATSAVWNETHEEDSRFAPGYVYDRDPALGRGNGRYDSRYYGVARDKGRVISYNIRFPPGTSIARARRLVRAEFPADATVKFAKRKRCSLMWVSSKTLKRYKLGTATVGFSSGEAGDSYDPSDVWGAGIVPGHLTQC